MTRRLGTLILALAVILAGSATCPRGALSCPIAMRVNHGCCHGRAALRKSDCCSGTRSAPAAAVSSTAAQGHDPLSNAPVAAAIAGPVHTVSRTARRAVIAAALAPPDTPVTQHTTLLL